MEIRLAQLDDKKAILSIIKNVVIDMSSQGIDQWDQIYPNEEVVTEDILDGEVYVASEDTVIKGVVTLNEYQDEEYETIPGSITEIKSWSSTGYAWIRNFKERVSLPSY